MRHAGRSCQSDMFYQNFELSGWQQRNRTKGLPDKELATPTLNVCVGGGTEHFVFVVMK